MEAERPKIAVSACLTGEPVRYDGGHRCHRLVVESLARHFRLVPFCPEVAIGLGVPRPTIELVREARGVRARGVADPGRDVTDALAAFARAFVRDHPDLAGVVFKARSPSCGLGTPCRPGGRAVGIFAAVVAGLRPDLPLIEEEALDDPRRREAFLEAVRRL